MKNLTDITFILDRSGSMASMVNDVVGGWKSFIEKQKAEVGECLVSLVQFDTEYETPFVAVPIANVSESLNFKPRGGTALRDAIGRTINSVGARFRSLKADQRPDKVLIVIMTDGEENSSHEFTQHQIQNMVKHQQDQYQWEFLFLGANIDSFDVGHSLGIAPWAITNYSYTSKGMNAGFNTVSVYSSCLRSGKQFIGTLSQCQAKNEADDGSTPKNAADLTTPILAERPRRMRA